MEGILFTYSIRCYEVPHPIWFWFVTGFDSFKPVVVRSNEAVRVVFVFVNPVGGEEDQFAVFFFYEICELVLSRGESLGVDVHAYSYAAVEGLSLQIFNLHCFEAWSLFGPELIGVVEMSLAGVEDKFPLPVAQGCWIVEHVFAFFLAFFNISKQDIGPQF